MLIYTQVQNIRTFLKLRKSVRLVRRIRVAVLTFVRVRRTSLQSTLWYKVSQTLIQYHSNSQRLGRGEDGPWWRRCDTKQKPGMRSSKVSLMCPRGKTKSELPPAVVKTSRGKHTTTGWVATGPVKGLEPYKKRSPRASYNIHLYRSTLGKLNLRLPNQITCGILGQLCWVGLQPG